MANSLEVAKRATDAIDLAKEELSTLVLAVGDPQSGVGDIGQHFLRWRDRTADALNTAVSPGEATKFRTLRKKPRWVQDDTWLEVFQEHFAFLVALGEDVHLRPDTYTRSNTRPRKSIEPRPEAPKVPAANRTATALPFPEKVTLPWLARHTTVLQWVGIATFFLGSLSAAFVLGARMGQNATFLSLFGEQLGLSVPTPTPSAPSGVTNPSPKSKPATIP
jgi:hypothetical protein